jgi:hypothetical protein
MMLLRRRRGDRGLSEAGSGAERRHAAEPRRRAAQALAENALKVWMV